MTLGATAAGTAGNSSGGARPTRAWPSHLPGGGHTVHHPDRFAVDQQDALVALLHRRQESLADHRFATDREVPSDENTGYHLDAAVSERLTQSIDQLALVWFDQAELREHRARGSEPATFAEPAFAHASHRGASAGVSRVAAAAFSKTRCSN